MSLVPGVKNPAIDNLVQSSLESERGLRLKWIPCSEITNLESTPTDAIYCARHKGTYGYGLITLVFLGNSEECTPTFVSEFARIYSLPTYKYNNDVNQFRRYFPLTILGLIIWSTYKFYFVNDKFVWCKRLSRIKRLSHR